MFGGSGFGSSSDDPDFDIDAGFNKNADFGGGFSGPDFSQMNGGSFS